MPLGLVVALPTVTVVLFIGPPAEILEICMAGFIETSVIKLFETTVIVSTNLLLKVPVKVT